MFEIITNPEMLFEHLNKYFKNDIQFNNSQCFIINETELILIIYTKQAENENLIGYQLHSAAHPYQSGMQLLQYLEDHELAESPVYLEAREALHQHLLSLKSSEMFFDAH